MAPKRPTPPAPAIPYSPLLKTIPSSQESTMRPAPIAACRSRVLSFDQICCTMGRLLIDPP